MDFLNRIRKNHALEHATITIAHSKLNERGILGGNSTQWGFFVYGEVPTDVLSRAADEALERLKTGEEELAISPYCGTNLLVTATLTGLACAVALGTEQRWRNIPRAVSVALAALVASRPIGTLVQKHFTTDGAIGRLSIEDISHIGVGGLTVHRVSTSSDD
ncbi:MAG: DUF6391 domain-containing protein [Chloroflexi bacterium]|nr:DUF6391 domain-containing protein [Chloroflexota bacterium]